MYSVVIPTPEQAVDLRALFAGNPVIDAAVQALLADGPVHRVCDAATLLEGWHFLPELSNRERLAVLARFTPEPASKCTRCWGDIEYVTEGPDPGWWRHSDIDGLLASSRPHPATPHYAREAVSER